MELNRVLDLSKGSIISIVGAGGKTTLMNLLARELKGKTTHTYYLDEFENKIQDRASHSKNNKILVTTTTKIYKPKSEDYDFIALGSYELNNLKHSMKNRNGIYVYGDFINYEGKLVGINPELLESEIEYFDYIIIEADGSKGKSIKGWNSTEPVIYDKTNKTIGVLTIDILGKEINEANVHRVEKFNEITNGIVGEKITNENFLSVIFHKDGLFKKAKGEKILFINKIDSNEDYENSLELLKLISKENNKNKLLDKIVFGSLKRSNFDILK